MNKKGQYLFPAFLAVILILSLVTDWYNILVYGLTGVLLLFSLDKLGKGIVLRELIAFHGCVICLLMPLLGYEIYNEHNAMARLWVRYMPLPKDVYFSFALPAMAAFSAAICWPIRNQNVSDSGQSLTERINSIKVLLLKRPAMGVYLIAIGVVSYKISGIVPESIRFVAVLLYWASFSGVLYLYYTRNFRYQKIVLLVFCAFVVVDAIRAGMFTIIAYMGITILSFFFINKKVRLWKKVTLFSVAIATLFLVQSIKSSYRKLTWRGEYAGSKIGLFTDLFTDKLLSSAELITVNAFFPIYYRTNQGYNVGLVMRRIPMIQPYDYGRTLSVSLASSLVPRVIWQDKPIAGGKFNMQYYAGISIRGWSTNIGPLGEAYGSFGHTGGIIFMFVLGVFIRKAYIALFNISAKVPLALFWLPVIFYQVAYSMETDTLQILNSIFKGAFLVWIIYKIFPEVFGVEKNTSKRRPYFTKTTSNTINSLNG